MIRYQSLLSSAARIPSAAITAAVSAAKPDAPVSTYMGGRGALAAIPNGAIAHKRLLDGIGIGDGLIRFIRPTGSVVHLADPVHARGQLMAYTTAHDDELPYVD